MKNNKFVKILTNLLLMTAFILTYFLDFTGLELHQYLGVAAGVFLMIHILTHAQWIKQVSARFLSKVSKKVRFYYFMDALLLSSILVITVTGIIISTWITISYKIYPMVRDIHIIASVSGLALLVLKLAFHWKFFISLFRKLRIPKSYQAEPAVFLTAPSKSYSRRDALKAIGAVSIVGAFGLYKAVAAMSVPNGTITEIANNGIDSRSSVAQAQNPSTSTPQPIAQASQESQGGGKQRRRGQGKSENETNSEQSHSASVAPTIEIENTPMPTVPTMPPSSQDCIIRCSRGCSFPGQCRRYIDENANQLCDLGECLPA